ncbi:phytolongin Phyl2.2 [Cajanus cajan]|nr:phytolongin Phyl2.2 [Cajanus cajan]
MIPNPELIQYACIARSTTILAQHQSEKEASMESLAAQCVAQAPPNHSMFSHTVDNRSFTFLIDPPFVFFTISHHTLLKSQTLPFLHRLRSSFRQTLPSNHHFAPLSFQPHFHSIFTHALRFDPHAPPPPLPSPPQPQPQPQPHFLKKKKTSTLDVLADDVVSLKPLHHHHKPKHVWKKHVWVLLLLDLFVCTVLFVIWLWVCSGFKCMTY